MAARRRKRRKKVQKKNSKRMLGIVGGSVGVLAAAYIGVGAYFSSHFLPNTEINGHDCSGKSVSEVEEVFKEEMKAYALTISDMDGGKEEITSDDIHLEYKESKALKKELEKQNSFLWPRSIFFKDSADATIELSYNEEELTEKIESLKAVTVEQIPSESAVPEFDGNQFVVKPEVQGTAVKREVLDEKIAEAVNELKPEIDLKAEKCYDEPKYTSDSKEVAEACEEMNQYCRAGVTYSMDEQVAIDASVISGWLSVDEDMKVTLSDDGIKKWLEEFGDKYDTMGTERTFTTPTGKTATVNGGDYGWSIDEDSEFEAIKDALAKGESVTKEPAYYVGGTAAAHEMPDWGGTFAEVDLSQQHMWYVADGEVALETDVVTGEPIPEKITPTGTYVLKEKEKDSVLVGETNPSTGKPSYRTHVDYWMRITWEGIGFHDASWQPAFGGSLYKKSGVGSHGCVNMPPDKAAALFDMIEVGTPVIIHD